METVVFQLLGFFLSLFGLAGTITVAILPHWWNSAHVGTNIIPALAYIKGLWMECVWHSTGIAQCQFHHSLLALPRDMMVISCLFSTLACVIVVTGMKCTQSAKGSSTENTFAVLGGILFILAGIACLIPVSWATNDAVTNFYNPTLPNGMKYEIGHALYLGIGCASLSIIGGVILCARCRQVENDIYSQQQSRSTKLAPSPRPPMAYKSNHSPSRASASYNGYRLNDCV